MNLHHLDTANQQSHYKDPSEIKLMEVQDEDILSHGIDLAPGEDYSQLFQSFDIFDQDQLFSQPENPPKKEHERNSKNNNMIDQANLYLNLSSKM